MLGFIRVERDLKTCVYTVGFEKGCPKTTCLSKNLTLLKSKVFPGDRGFRGQWCDFNLEA